MTRAQYHRHSFLQMNKRNRTSNHLQIYWSTDDLVQTAIAQIIDLAFLIRLFVNIYLCFFIYSFIHSIKNNVSQSNARVICMVQDLPRTRTYSISSWHMSTTVCTIIGWQSRHILLNVWRCFSTEFYYDHDLSLSYYIDVTYEAEKSHHRRRWVYRSVTLYIQHQTSIHTH
jgi:hypothetical protein